MTHHFLALTGETPDSFRLLLDRSAFWKRSVREGMPESARLSGRGGGGAVLALLFQKPSTRTRVSFEMAMHHFGGRALYLSPSEVGLGSREAPEDVARVLGRYVDGIMARVFQHDDLISLARFSGVPVINGLSDIEHPCQALADFLTIFEHSTKEPAGGTLTFLGDGNNVCHSLMIAAALTGTHFRWCGPKGYEPLSDYVDRFQEIAEETKSRLELTNDVSAAAGSDFLYTDVWASMGQEDEAEKRRERFRRYQLNEDVLEKSPGARVLHCLPAHRGEEITDGVIDNPNVSVVFEQAENRLYAQMAVLERAFSE